MANLAVRFNLWQVEGQCNTLYFEDVTPDHEADESGYGGINPERSEVEKTRIYVSLPSGGVYVFDGLYKPRAGKVLSLQPQFFTQGRLVRQEVLDDPELACIYKMNGQPTTTVRLSDFKDGCYKVLYEVYSKVKVPVRKCTYEASGAWQSGWQFLAVRNGAEYNLTSALTVLEGEFWFKAEKTSDVHTTWRVRDANNVTQCSGEFSQHSCYNSSDARQTVSEAVVVSASNVEATMLCRAKLRQSHGAHQLVVVGQCKGNQSEALQMYSLASDKLVALQNRGEECDCGCADKTLQEINQIFDYII